MNVNIVVLCGGISTEREVSIRTGKMVCQALRTKGHNAIALDVYCGNTDIDVLNPFKSEYDVENEFKRIEEIDIDKVKEEKANNDLGFFGENVLKVCKKSDIVFMALHGENGENGNVQAAFELNNIKYTGTGPLGSAMAMDKGITKEILTANHVPSPKGVKIRRGESTNLAEYGISIPCVVKPCCGGSSVGVTVVLEEKDYEAGLSEAFKYEDEILIEEYIKGREFSVGVIAERALPVIEIIPKTGFYDYKNKYVAGMTDEICPANLDEKTAKEMQENAVRAAKALRLGSYCRIDFLLKENGEMYCLEANTLPGMTATSLLPQEAKVEGIEFEDLCELLIKESLK